MSAARNSKSSSSGRVLAGRLATLGVFILAGYFIADVAVLYSRQYMLPSQQPPSRPRPPNMGGGLGNYQNVTNRNPFSYDGKMPPALAASGAGQQQELPPVPSQLPLTLLGTLVHSNPDKSIASIDIRGKNQILSFRPKQEIESLATLEKVERMKVIIRNRNTGRLEYIEMKDSPKLALKGAAPSGSGGGTDVRKTGNNQFEINRGDLLKYTNDLSSVLMQARVVPATRPGSGEIYGFRMVEMQPNSVYTQLGLQVMDVITCVNGNPVTSGQQAMELYSTLRNSAEIQICVERGGQNQNLNYRIKN